MAAAAAAAAAAAVAAAAAPSGDGVSEFDSLRSVCLMQNLWMLQTLNPKP